MVFWEIIVVIPQYVVHREKNPVKIIQQLVKKKLLLKVSFFKNNYLPFLLHLNIPLGILSPG